MAVSTKAVHALQGRCFKLIEKGDQMPSSNSNIDCGSAIFSNDLIISKSFFAQGSALVPTLFFDESFQEINGQTNTKSQF